jgi:site-specific DNA-methyltransferase (adenine-specific)
MELLLVGWDSVIPFEPMWKELTELQNYNSAIALFGSEPFSSQSIDYRNLDYFRYDLIYRPSNMF